MTDDEPHNEPNKSLSLESQVSETVSPSLEYVVVARRYRPQSFGELIGQSQVTQALENAINTNRVGHAYLFTGARGVGKTSAARILAKALNCVDGPTTSPCQTCDICQSITCGSDVDVIEIDGASNRGIDEIRQLRSSIGVRPSRARSKIYIIDEVHMLTKEAFNALLKTLEEPPEHVKFVFCTTDPEKIPITVLSRCQRFDFAPIDVEAIVARLREIVAAEGAKADPAALELLARKAAGSMRDSQSLLEQLLSFGGDHITTDTVHSMLGTADAAVVTELVAALQRSDAAGALAQLDAAIAGGVDVGQLAEQLIGYLRDVMTAGVGGSDQLLRFVPASDYPMLCELANQWGLPTVLSALQLVDHAVVRMRQVLHRRTLVELAIVRICELENLTDIATALASIHHPNAKSAQSSGREKKTSSQPSPAAVTEPVARHSPVTPLAATDSMAAESTATGSTATWSTATGSTATGSTATGSAATGSTATGSAATGSAATGSPNSATSSTSTATATSSITELTSHTATRHWQDAVGHLPALDANLGRQYKRIEVDNRKLIVCFDSPLNVKRFQQDEQSRALKRALQQQTGLAIELEFRMEQDTAKPTAGPKKKSGMVLVRESYHHPWVREAVDLFEGNITHVHQAKSNQSSEESPE
jgi:DNA polymerase-3 subunit gamma/tau